MVPTFPLRRAAAAFAAAVLLLTAPAGAADGPTVPRFLDETAASGIAGGYQGDWEYMVGGGAAAFDCDDDGFPDLLTAGGTDPGRFYRNVSTRGGPIRFEAETSGLELTGVGGAYPLDVDGDGRTDIVLLRVGENVVMRGLGGCRFERANEAWGFAGGDAWSTAFSATWEKGAPWPTVAVGNYIDRTKTMPWGSCTDNWLQRPAVEGDRPQRRFAPPIPLKPSFCALSILFTDWNRSGRQSLRVSNDREYYKGGQEQMWRLEPGQPPRLYADTEGWKYLRIWGMGIASTDLDGDGYPEYFLTSMADNKLQKLAATPEPGGSPKPAYADVAYSKGLTAHRPYTGGDVRPSTGWHAEFQDVNNDGLNDLFIAKGNVAEMPDFAAKDPNNLLVQGADGRFVEMGDKAGVASMRISRGAALPDFNLDGLVDLVVVNRWKEPELYRNVTEGAGHFIALRLLEDGPNRDAIGSWIEVKLGDRIIRHEVTVGGGHAGAELGWRHVGLGAVTRPELRVLWPDGTAGPWAKVAADAFYVVERGREPAPWTPPR